MKTVWNTDYYNPVADNWSTPKVRVAPPPRVCKPTAPPTKRVRPPAPPPEGAFDPQHHLIYAAMIDGCIGQGALAARLGLSHADVKNAQKVLCKRGYIRVGYWNHHRAYVPVEIDSGDKPPQVGLD